MKFVPVWLTLISLALVGGCFEEPPYTGGGVGSGSGNFGNVPAPPDDGDGNQAGAPPVVTPGVCRVGVKTSQDLPARITAMSTDAAPTDEQVYVSDLYNRFKAQCGACHVEQPLGGFQITASNFTLKVDKDVLARITSDDPAQFMPPRDAGGVPFKDRKDSDPVAALAKEIDLWQKAGSPPDIFYVPTESAGSVSYALSPEVGNSLTNLGNCVPEADFPFARDTKVMNELDELFADLEPTPPGMGTLEEQLGLPKTLAETDLTTLDSDKLAQRGVIAFAPGYPLWSDDAGKLRHVRVPVGETIHFDKKTQHFVIPPNTRFYKTFMKDVIDADGTKRFKKMETRLIVSRPDSVDDRGNREPTALFGTYKWDENETEATLVTLAQRNGEPFKDEMLTYILDETKANEIRAKNPQNLTYELEFNGLLRHYAIPGKERCIQCHRGAIDGSFVLGFTPMQIRRRPMGEGGVIEPSGPDELNQLQRLIDLKVIDGIDSADEILTLEESQGERHARNEHELTAQAYMLGNCAHCHNPHGYPSVAAPELAPLLDFYPSPTGGIFEFPLERYSPRIFRSAIATPMPYITPSLWELNPPDFQALVFQSDWKPKFAGTDDTADSINAPWRSLIYRNTQTPFTYSDDLTIFPHMPLNTPGHDCRASQIFGDWMVSVPAVRKRLDLVESFIPVSGNLTGSPEARASDQEPQPYVEVKKGEDGYDDAVAAAQDRLELFHTNGHYDKCPDTSDIIDPSVVRGLRDAPADTDASINNAAVIPDGVPDHAHWVETDLTENRGDWAPRRTDWEDVLVHGKFPVISGTAPNRVELLAKQEAEKKVVAELGSVHLTSELRDFVGKGFPLGLWKKKDGCTFPGQKTAADFKQTYRWPNQATITGSEPVFMPTPGQAVFDMICVNCHGRNADSKGRQAETVQILTGGQARVANFMSGLFGPVGSSGSNRQRVFGPAATAEVQTDEWGARYLTWMALGGTQRNIPKAVLSLVGRTPVCGVEREKPLAVASPNMLAAAQAACGELLPLSDSGARLNMVERTYAFTSHDTNLIEETGEAEMWQSLCNIDNPSPVRGVVVNGARVDQPDSAKFTAYSLKLYRREHYPANVPIGNHSKGIDSTLKSDNLFPWCLIKDSEAKAQAANEVAAQYYGINGTPLPFCPDSLAGHEMEYEETHAWATRGAANAGMAVFMFLDSVSRGNVKLVRYDQCELLQQ